MDKTIQQLLHELETLRQENEALRSAAQEHRRTEEALKASEQRYRTIVEHAPEAIVVLNFDTGHFMDVNANAERLFKMEREALLHVGPIEMSAPVQPDGRLAAEAALEYLRRALDGETPVFEWIHRNSEGEDIPCEVRLVRVPDVERRLVRGSVTDITERKRAEEAQRKLQQERDLLLERLRLQIDRMPFAYLLNDSELRLVDWNPAAEKLFGYTKAEVLGKHPFDLIVPPESREYVMDIFQRLQRGDMEADGTAKQRTKDGRPILCEWRNTPLLNPDGTFSGLLSMAQDVTERERAAERQRTLLAGLHAIVEIADELIACPDVECLCQRAVELARERLGLERCSIFLVEKGGTILRGTYGTDDQGETTDERAHVLPKTEYWTRLFKSKQPQDRYWTAIDRPHSYWDGATSVFVGGGWVAHTPIETQATQIGFFFNDMAISGGPLDEAQQETVVVYCSFLGHIIERKRLEEQLLRAQKLESVGRLAGGIAHDFNNLLTAILGYTELAEDDLAPDSASRGYLENVRKAAERAATLTYQLLAFARKQIIAPRVVVLNELVHEIDTLLRRLIGENIELVTISAIDLWRVKVDPGQLEQVLINLAINARDAMPDGGKLTIETQNVVLGEDYARQRAEVVPGEYVLLAVSDTGVGMTEEVQAHIFEPFFTTKEVGRGTGLGLATCYGIVKQSGGHIAAYSEPGHGATFKVYLPRVQEAVSPLTDPLVTLPRGHETILLVEDEALVRDIAARTLRGQGYTVLEAQNGLEGLRVAQEYTGTLDLVVTDVVMPQMGGKELAEQLRAARSDFVLLYTSGYTDNAIVQHGVLDSDIAFLSKPFTPAALIRKVRDVLDAHQSDEGVKG